MDYLPNAVSFIFVINVNSAGGMQTDRVNILWFLLFSKTINKFLILLKRFLKVEMIFKGALNVILTCPVGTVLTIISSKLHISNHSKMGSLEMHCI